MSECSDWDADLQEQTSKVRTPLRRPKFLPISLTYQTPKPPARWPNGVKIKAPTAEPEQECTNSKSLEDIE